MRPVTRKSLTVDAIVRRRIEFRLGMTVRWGSGMTGMTGVIVSMDTAGATVEYEKYDDDCDEYIVRDWFAYEDIRPVDGRRYL